MSKCELKSYNAKRAKIFGKRLTNVQKLISIRSFPETHSEFKFSDRYKKVSFSATLEDGCKCARFKLIEYSHERERWDTTKIPMNDLEEDNAWLRACITANLPIDWLYPEPLTGRRSYYGFNAIPYDLIGQLCHATKLKIWKPSKNKTWCSKAVSKVICEGRKDFLVLLERFKLMEELRPDQLAMMARYFFIPNYVNVDGLVL